MWTQRAQVDPSSVQLSERDRQQLYHAVDLEHTLRLLTFPPGYAKIYWCLYWIC